MKPFDIEAAKNGAPVCTRDGSKARILCFDKNDTLTLRPIVALIDYGEGEVCDDFYIDGRKFPDVETRADLFMYEKPEPQFKPFDKVLVRNCVDEVWRANFFSHINDTRAHKYDCLVAMWKYCIPYEGNEHLLGTTDNPKED